MAERPRRPITDAELERALRDLGDELAYPPTPDLARSVRARLAAGPAPRRPFWPTLFPLRPAAGLALLALVVLASAVLALAPGARDSLARQLGLVGVEIRYVPSVEAPPVGSSLGFGDRLTLAEARSRVGYRVLLPTGPALGEPDEAYVGQPPPGGQVALVYRARPGLPPAAETGVGLLLTQFRGDTEAGLVAKSLGPETRLESVVVNGGPGFWIEGRPHLFLYRDRDGDVREETIRLAGNVLLWQQDGLTLRLEAALSRDEALRIAATVR